MIVFADWKPDQPDLLASGEVKNCIWRDGAYRPFLALSEDTNALTATAKGAASFAASEQRTNLQIRSEELDNAAWSQTRASISANAAVAPDGTTTADKLVEDSSASTTHLLLSTSNITVSSGAVHTTTVFAKKAERDWIQIQEGQGVTASAYFDLTNGATGTVAGTGSPSASIEEIGDGWYRCALHWTSSGTAARVRVYLATGDGGASYSGDGSSGVYLWGAQLEAGASASPYIKTVGSSVSADYALLKSYAGDASKLYDLADTTWTDRSASTYATPLDGYWKFASFCGKCIAVNGADAPQSVSLTGTTFAALSGSPPTASEIGVVGRFLVLGNISSNPHRIQWSAIDDPEDWPTPLTNDARAKQAGRQDFNEGYGEVRHIVEGELDGIVFQESAISRMSYVGGDIVFTFSTFERSRGLYAPNAIVQVGNLVYFLSHDGFFATDGNTVEPIGDGKVDETFLGEIAASSLHKITAAKDPVKTLIHFGIQTTGNNPDKIYTYNYSDGRWTRSEQAHQILFSEDNGASPRLLGFSTDNKSGEFDGSALTATIDTQEAILTPGRRSFVSSLRPIVTGSGTITAKLGTRDAPDDSVSYTSSVSLNSRTKKAAFRSDAYYHRARVDISGGFTEAIGVEFDAIPSSAA